MEHFRDELWDDEEAWNDVKTSAANDDEWEFSQARSAWDIFSDRFQRLFSQHFPKRDVPAREVSKMALKEWRFASSQARASFEHLAQQEQSHFVSRLEWHETGHALRRSSRRPQRRGAEALSSRDGGDLTTAGVSHSSQQFSRGRYNSAADLEGPADENEVDPNERQVDRVGIVCNSRQGDYMVSHDQVECECDECDGRVMSASEFVVHAGLANVRSLLFVTSFLKEFSLSQPMMSKSSSRQAAWLRLTTPKKPCLSREQIAPSASGWRSPGPLLLASSLARQQGLALVIEEASGGRRKTVFACSGRSTTVPSAMWILTSRRISF